jgi:hypothetical protein
MHAEWMPMSSQVVFFWTGETQMYTLGPGQEH